MARHFDYQEWIEAAEKRRRLTPDSPEIVHQRFHEDKVFINKLARAIDWCERRGLKVVFTAQSGGVYKHDEKTIEVTYRSYPDIQLYTLLHEAGHHLVWCSNPKLYKERYERGYQRVTEDDRTSQHKIDAIAEELEAWYRGWKLARRLKIYIDKEKYTACRNRNVRTYFRWALDQFEYSDKRELE